MLDTHVIAQTLVEAGGLAPPRRMPSLTSSAGRTRIESRAASSTKPSQTVQSVRAESGDDLYPALPVQTGLIVGAVIAIVRLFR